MVKKDISSISPVEIDSIYEKMNDDNLRFTDGLVDEIIDYVAPDISASALDVKDIAIYTLYSIVVLGNNSVAKNIIRKSICGLIGDSEKTFDYLKDTLSCISASDDMIADEYFERLENEQLEMVVNG